MPLTLDTQSMVPISSSELMASEEPPTPDFGLQVKMESRVDDSLQATRRMRRMVDESRTAAAAALTSLDHQGRQLDHMERELDAVDAGVAKSSAAIKEMERCCCYDLCCFCCCCCGGGKKAADEEEAVAWSRDSGDDVSVIRSQYQYNNHGLDKSFSPSAHSLSSSSVFGAGLLHRITNDAREDEMEENLGDVHDTIAVLRNMALDQGTTISQQNQQIGRITDHVNATDDRITGVNKRVQNLLK